MRTSTIGAFKLMPKPSGMVRKKTAKQKRRWRRGCDAHREQAQAQGVESHRGFGDQPIRAGTYEAYRPGMGSTEHIKEKGGTHHREDDASADHAMHAHSG